MGQFKNVVALSFYIAAVAATLNAITLGYEQYTYMFQASFTFFLQSFDFLIVNLYVRCFQ
jgi:hypothetical protein